MPVYRADQSASVWRWAWSAWVVVWLIAGGAVHQRFDHHPALNAGSLTQAHPGHDHGRSTPTRRSPDSENCRVCLHLHSLTASAAPAAIVTFATRPCGDAVVLDETARPRRPLEGRRDRAPPVHV